MLPTGLYHCLHDGEEFCLVLLSPDTAAGTIGLVPAQRLMKIKRKKEGYGLWRTRNTS